MKYNCCGSILPLIRFSSIFSFPFYIKYTYTTYENNTARMNCNNCSVFVIGICFNQRKQVNLNGLTNDKFNLKPALNYLDLLSVIRFGLTDSLFNLARKKRQFICCRSLNVTRLRFAINGDGNANGNVNSKYNFSCLANANEPCGA